MPTDPMVPRMARIEAVREEVPGTSTLCLDLPSVGPFLPGQFNMLYAFGIGEIPVSISSDPANPRELGHTVRAVGAVSRAIAALKPGTAIGVRGPFGTAWPLEAARGRDILLIGGGLGLASLRPAIFDILSNRRSYRRVMVLYGTRTPADRLFLADLARWELNHDLELHVTVDRAAAPASETRLRSEAPAQSGSSLWRGHVGVVPSLLAPLGLDPAKTVAMMCGPEVMMRFTVRELERRGVPDSSIYLSLERNMKCAVGFCGHCQYGPYFVCKDGPVFRYDRIARLFRVPEV